jgi:MFS superfamily sulfate permease-like transporter
MSYVFDLSHEHMYTLAGHSYELGPKFLINLPGQILSAITFPDFSVITSGASIKYIIMFALVGSIESLLTVCAVDNLDPEKQKSDLNKDLFATGFGNLISSFIGGLPMISEIVRTKANIDYEAKTKYSNFFHGVFLLLSIVLIPGILKQIPLTALAALLVYTGMRLASPAEFIKAYKIGVDQFILFVATLVVTLLTDLLVGVGVGILLKILLHLLRGASISDFFKLKYTKNTDKGETEIQIQGSLVFSNFLTLKKLIQSEISFGNKVTLNLRKIKMIDHTIQEKLETFVDNNGLKIQGLNTLKAASDHHQAFRKVSH